MSEQVTAPPVYASHTEAVLARFRAVRARQETLYADPHIRVMLLGVKGSRKTSFIKTARKPIFIDSFDPGGTLSIDDFIKDPANECYVDAQYETEDLRAPTAMDAWEREFEGRCKDGFFNSLGTYVLDGYYLMMESLLAKQRKKFGVGAIDDMTPESAVKGKDLRNLYGMFLEANLYWTRRILNLPCNVIMTCHLDTYMDVTIGRTETTILAPGNASKERVPVPFPEVWVRVQEEENGKLTDSIITGPSGRYRGSTRIGKMGKLALKETPDFCAILRKCGYPTESKGSIPL